jgi:predicted small metal-binding protein
MTTEIISLSIPRELREKVDRLRGDIACSKFIIRAVEEHLITEGVLGCDYIAKGETEEELWTNGTEHLIKAHGMKAEDITPQFKHYYRQYIKHHSSS